MSNFNSLTIAQKSFYMVGLMTVSYHTGKILGIGGAILIIHLQKKEKEKELLKKEMESPEAQIKFAEMQKEIEENPFFHNHQDIE